MINLNSSQNLMTFLIIEYHKETEVISMLLLELTSKKYDHYLDTLFTHILFYFY